MLPLADACLYLSNRLAKNLVATLAGSLIHCYLYLDQICEKCTLNFLGPTNGVLIPFFSGLLVKWH
jgi:hypothetical protein